MFTRIWNAHAGPKCPEGDPRSTVRGWVGFSITAEGTKLPRLVKNRSGSAPHTPHPRNHRGGRLKHAWVAINHGRCVCAHVCACTRMFSDQQVPLEGLKDKCMKSVQAVCHSCHYISRRKKNWDASQSPSVSNRLHKF